MTEYALYLESGPRRRKTMVHVLDPLGCIANGPTTEAALEATPKAIRAYLRFLARHAEPVDPDAPFSTRVAEHITEGEWLGNGSPYITFAPDLQPVSEEELHTFIARFRALREDLATWAGDQSDEALDAPRAGGRTARAILLHVLATPGAYLSPLFGGLPGYSRLVTATERGDIQPVEGLRRMEEIACAALLAATPEQRSRVIERGQMLRTLRKAIRRTLEHDWEHLVELSRRPGGPVL